MNAHRPNSVFIVFKKLEDPRKRRNQICSLFDIITFSILAILRGTADKQASYRSSYMQGIDLLVSRRRGGRLSQEVDKSWMEKKK
ncbi:hypothetical protein [Neochlamydia sp. S13]|uniref:hypothetical protein n=1 Tax=Neochlamydia sp. S13 TaxID=1353976 RepID=UPI0005AB2BF7|nr:hypothetical protein [Neochlamydia sp. S13]BBI17417.1 hypothetical protein NCS13_1_1222 [Neochlamydia sp. S13]